MRDEGKALGGFAQLGAAGWVEKARAELGRIGGAHTGGRIATTTRNTDTQLSKLPTARGHKTDIRNDTRDVSRRITRAANLSICRRKCRASDRACTRLTLPNLHGKEGVYGSSPSEGFVKTLQNGSFSCLLRRSAGFSRVRDGYISGREGIRGQVRPRATTVRPARTRSRFLSI